MVLAMKVALGIVGLIVFGGLGWLVLHPQSDGDREVHGKIPGFEIGASSKYSTEKKAIVVDPSLPGTISAPGVSVKKGELVEVIPARDFKWACKGEAITNNYNWVGPGGDSNYAGQDQRTMLPDAPFCALIGRVGTGTWHYLGDSNTFTADSSGRLYLTANDVTPKNCPLSDKSECYSDNKGSSSATVSVNVGK
jgi:hypothetical protein